MKGPNSQAPEVTASLATEKQFLSDLRGPRHTVRSAHTLIGEAIGAVLQSPEPQDVRSRNITAKLLTRIARDLFCAASLVEVGYPVQALSLVASLFEVAFTVAYIRDDNSRAEDWNDHLEPTQMFGGAVYTLVQGAIAQLNLPNSNEVVKKQYHTYRQLCMAKHANPLLEKSFGVSEGEDRSVLGWAPVFDAKAFRMAWYALTNGSRLAAIAIGVVVDCHIGSQQAVSVQHDLDSLYTRVHDHNRFARSKGWDEDPYPGRW